MSSDTTLNKNTPLGSSFDVISIVIMLGWTITESPILIILHNHNLTKRLIAMLTSCIG